MLQKYEAFIKIVTETLMETYSSGKIKEKKIDRNFIDAGKDKKKKKTTTQETQRAKCHMQ